MPEKTGNLRLAVHPVTGRSVEDRKRIKIFIDDQPYEAFEGESLAAALWANGLMTLGRNPEAGLPRGMYCGIGHCCECRVTLDGVGDVRSCLTLVREGMQVILQRSEPSFNS
jgi:sarcosine oxidase subunit alpha